MAIQFIDNQPITFKTDWETDSECKTSNDRACTVYSTDDYIYAQFKQTPCGDGDNIICSTDFVNPNGDELTNGTFDTDTSGWTLDNATYDSANHRVQFSNSLNGDLYQDILSISVGDWYTLTFTLGGATNGYIYLYAGGVSYEDIRYTNGTYTFNFQWTGTSDTIFAFYTESNIPLGRFPYNGWIDNVSLQKPVLTDNPCWEAGDFNNWQVNDTTSVTKIPGTADYLASPIAIPLVGGYFRFDLTVSNMTIGTLQIKDALGGVIGTITANGTYSFFWTLTTGQVFTYYADAEFNGTLSNFGLIQYGNNFSFQLTDGSTIYDLSDQVEYYQDWVTLKADASGIMPGCYQLVVYDACNITEAEPMNNVPDLITTGSEWFNITPSNCNAVFSGTGLLEMTGPPVAPGVRGGLWLYNSAMLTFVGSLAGTTNYQIEYEIHTGTVVGDWYGGIIETDINSFYDIVGNAIHLTASNTTYTGSFIYNVLDPFAPDMAVAFSSTNNIQPTDQLQITYIQFTATRWVPNNVNPTYSNCIEITSDTDCTKWIGGTNGEDAYGFHFDNTLDPPFQLGARVRSMLINPKYPGELKRYNDAGGKFTVTRGASDKSFTLFIDYTDEHTHDWLRLATHCDTLNIGYSHDSYKEYVATDGDYEPEWPSSLGDWPSAQARIEIQKKVSTLYNNNAG